MAAVSSGLTSCMRSWGGRQNSAPVMWILAARCQRIGVASWACQRNPSGGPWSARMIGACRPLVRRWSIHGRSAISMEMLPISAYCSWPGLSLPQDRVRSISTIDWSLPMS